MTDGDYVKLLGRADAQAIALRLESAKPELRATKQDIGQVVENIVTEIYFGSKRTNSILQSPEMLHAYKNSLVNNLIELDYMPATSVDMVSA